MSYREYKDSFDHLHRKWMNEVGDLHREEGPAYICHLRDGMTRLEQFYLNGITHRESGPAMIIYDPNGIIEREYFYLNGELLGYNKLGFWSLWDSLTHKQRQNYSLLKYLARFS